MSTRDKQRQLERETSSTRDRETASTRERVRASTRDRETASTIHFRMNGNSRTAELETYFCIMLVYR